MRRLMMELGRPPGVPSLTLVERALQVDVFAASPEQGAGGVHPGPPDFRAAIVDEHDGVVVLRLLDGVLPEPAPGTAYLVGDRGRYLEAKRVEWLDLATGRPRALLSVIAL